MFGQDPQLPVDFLLGRIQEPVVGSTHDWNLEHQTRLRHAFERASWFTLKQLGLEAIIKLKMFGVQ